MVGWRAVGWSLGIRGTAPPLLTDPTYLDPAEVVASPGTGLLYPLAVPDQRVAKGQPLVRVTDFFGETIAVIESPLDAVVLYVVATPPIVKAQPVAGVSTPRKLDRCMS